MRRKISSDKLIFITFLIIVANLILAIVLLSQIIPEWSMSPVTIQIFIMIFALMYYMLFIIYVTHYVEIFKENYQGNEHKYLITVSTIALVALASFSFWKLGTKSTFNWLIPTVAVILVPIVGYYWRKNTSKNKDSGQAS